MAAPDMDKDDGQRELKIGDWLWRPFHARLWWSLLALYWAGFAAFLRVDILEAFYNSALAGFINIFFFPPIVALILSYGFLKAWLAVAQHDLEDEAADYGERRRKRYGPAGMLKEFDPLDPASGAFWVGNPLNPLNAAYINRHPS